MNSRETSHIKKWVWNTFVTAHTLITIEIFSWKISKHPLPQPLKVREEVVYSEYPCWLPANLFLTTQKPLTLNSLFPFTKYTIGIIATSVTSYVYLKTSALFQISLLHIKPPFISSAKIYIMLSILFLRADTSERMTAFLRQQNGTPSCYFYL